MTENIRETRLMSEFTIRCIFNTDAEAAIFQSHWQTAANFRDFYDCGDTPATTLNGKYLVYCYRGLMAFVESTW